MRLAAGIALALAAAAPASAADTVARSGIIEGPVIAGDRAAWADRTPAKAVRVLTMRPGAGPVVARRWARPTALRTERDVWSIAADPYRLAAVVGTCTHSGGYELARCAPRVFSGSFAQLRGPRLPGRVGRRCRRDVRNAREVATGGGWTAAIIERFCPGTGIESLGARRRIEASGPGGRREIPLLSGYGLRLAGSFLAWQDGRGGAVVYDLRRGERVRRIGSARGRVGGLDVQADGTVAVTRFRPRSRVCVSTVTLAGAERRLRCRTEFSSDSSQSGDGAFAGPDPAVAISAGRVLYARDRGSELVLQRAGADPVVVTRFTARLRRVGGFDLGVGSATWARQPVRDSRRPDGTPGPPRSAGRPQIVLRRL